MKQNLWKISTFVLGVLLVLFLIYLTSNSCLVKRLISGKSQGALVNQAQLSKIAKEETVLAKEIYPLFRCPCCGSTIDECTCPMAKERRTYIDGLVDAKVSKDKVVLAYVKKYGLASFVDKDRQEEFREKLIAEAPSDRPIISITPDSYDLGNVSQKKGKVYTYFDLKNEGKSDLVIDRLDTSCGCTFVAILFEGKESPYFTMPGHGYENPEWEGVSIPPGKTAQLKVMYDPNVHPDFRGFAIREISVYSNDPIDFEKKVRIELNQVD